MRLRSSSYGVFYYKFPQAQSFAVFLNLGKPLRTVYDGAEFARVFWQRCHEKVALMKRFWLFLCCSVSLLAGETWKLYTSEPGMYQVSFADLTAAGFPEDVPSHELSLRQRDQATLLEVVDANQDGRFNAGDSLRFFAAHLHGELEYHNEHSKVNVFLLSRDASLARPYQNLELQATHAPASLTRASLRAEIDTLAMRFASNNQAYEMWYWHKLACTDKEPFKVQSALETPAIDADQTFDLEVGLRGFSSIKNKPSADFYDHELRVEINGHALDVQRWQGRESEVLHFKNLPTAYLRPEQNQVALSIPRRNDAKGQLVVDVAILNWVQIHYPQTAHVQGEAQRQFVLAGDQVLTLHNPMLGYTASGSRFSVTQAGSFKLPPGLSQTQVNLVSQQTFKPLYGVAMLQTQQLHPQDGGADYLMIAHHALLEAIEPLAEAHRARGLKVQTVDVSQIYDGFNDGIVHPRAIRDFIADSYHNWASKPRFVLLVGDASYDTKNTQILNENYPSVTFLRGRKTAFNHISATSYADQSENNRNLIPSWKTYTDSGHAASDNAFVCVDGDDILPDLAIGRLPVVSPDEVHAIVAKTLAYMEHPPVGEQRLNMLLITNEEEVLQHQTNQLARTLAQKGVIAQRVYPQPGETSNEHHSKHLQEAIEAGQYAIYFHGHGGRFIWRTGPPEPRKNHDLFTLDHVAALKNKDRYPIVYSFTCFSAPFDHPSADSIGERFLRQPHSGAVAFYGASWRNTPRSVANNAFMHNLLEAQTLGESILATKRSLRERELIEGYNLLGDPALPLQPLQINLALELADQQLSFDFLTNKKHPTNGVIMYRDAQGEVLARQNVSTTGSRTLDLKSFAVPARAKQIQLYMWNESGDEWFGVCELAEAKLNAP